MAGDPRLGERVYQEVRRRLFAGEFRLRERLDIGAVAASLGTSATPVREALVRLAAERLIASLPTRGFFVRLWSEGELRELYRWRGLLLFEALKSAFSPATPDSSLQYPERTARYFEALEGRANPELRRASVNADDRLFGARLAEREVMGDVDAELEELARAIASGAGPEAAQVYHARREAQARALRERAALHALGANGE